VHRRVSERLPSLLLGAALAVAASGCVPTCPEVCRKARACDLTPRLSQAECVESCDRQDAYYKIQGDNSVQQAYDDARRCVATSSCDEILAGACYEGDLFDF